jgi:hypothetical protein
MYGDEGRMSLTVRVPGDVRNLRVDPALCPCFVLPEKNDGGRQDGPRSPESHAVQRYGESGREHHVHDK